MKHILSLLLACTLLPGCFAGGKYAELSAQPVSVSGSQTIQSETERSGVYSALSSFGLELLQQARESKGDAVLVSPLSVSLALSMAANGAEGDTLAQFTDVLGGGADLDTLNAACAALTADYQNLGGSTQTSIANSVWVDPDGQIKEDFIGKCQGIFRAQVLEAELSAPAIVPALNGWVSDRTNGLIPKIISEPFDEAAAALLVNALYLKNTWEYEFDPNDTYKHDFTHAGGRTESMDFLNAGLLRLPYLRSDGAQGVALPYDDGRLTFFALMPDGELDSWLSGLEEDVLSRLVRSAEEAEFLHLGLPKFEAEWKGELSGVLSALGLENAFDSYRADFSSLGDSPEGYYLSQVIHAAKIKVNEKGTEAAAATAAVAATGAAAPPEDGVTLVFDRPFAYGILDLETGVPVFLGTFE